MGIDDGICENCKKLELKNYKMNPITITRVLKKKIMLSLLIIGSINGLAQSFLIPPMLDTIYFDANRYPNIHEGDTIYELGGQIELIENEFFTRLNQLIITRIDSIDYSDYMYDEIYLHSYFNRKIQVEVLNYWVLKEGNVDDFIKSDFRMCKNSFVVKFDKQIVAFSDAKGPLIVEDERNGFDLINFNLKSNNEFYKIDSASLCTIDYFDGSIQTIYKILTTDQYDHCSFFYIVVENNEIVDWYQYSH